MAAKIVFEIVLLMVAVALTASQSKRRCNVQEDCRLNECCSKRIFKDEAYCVEYRQLNEICLDGGLDETMYDEKYDITCPCQPGLTCMKKGVSDNKGEIKFTDNPTCRNLTGERLEAIRRSSLGSYISGGASAAEGRR
ncbi:prokineticin domain-containing protein [Caerostris darwini]|uniref:Prokineticin domain-containing protein n=1 Tax=Caerostris darwini TaxID=1538125 RepID=A0AAV4PSD4_9ARAC|nr:prokineticin domain-containing protein [Caerostris darwini]